MKLLYPILVSCLFFASSSYAQESGNYKTVCGYMPEGEFSEPIKKPSMLMILTQLVQVNFWKQFPPQL